MDIYYHFHHSVKRIEALKEYADFCSVVFKHVLSHCETRWLSLGRSVKRTLEMWEPLRSCFNSHGDVEKPGNVKIISSHLISPLTHLILTFQQAVMEIFDPVNLSFQSTSIATVHLHEETWRLLKRVLKGKFSP